MRALVVGASGGIGAALCTAMAQQGAEITRLSRSADGLDVTDEAAIEAATGPLSGTYERIIVATGALEAAGQPPEKTIRDLTPEALAAQFAVNAMGPALVLKHIWRLIPRDRPSAVAVLSARVGSIGDNRLGGWYSYRTAKAAVNQLVHTAAIELARSHREAVLVALHPGTVATPFTADYAGRHKTVPPAEAAHNLLNVIDGLTPADTGRFFDWKGEPVPW
ncbi:SDR family NAD(P)-dependent oxidoreductase [Acuticoccus sp. MNP-M23]|uniref:SDR family NAD(P)-dependent oxidoreductase n=1 Tax=Acuticoccus sp. MNP-M23 TaxID=3072793 RepID=UPI0028149ABF|nr:SDR family NAD(P)-dependent oxidoreductase [Acuticoccus sp. MNP-M23]WMS44872.1 SDR family NAD(P)-dependent oxidoreductase [Acuticoccus sp. MNP-M23]